MSGSSGTHTSQGRLTATNVSLRSFIMTAYGMKDYQVTGPDWLGSERFDLGATFPEALPKDKEKYNAAMRAMMQSMLVERFKLLTHREQTTFSVYGLTVGKSGIKFNEVPDTGSHNQNTTNTHYTGTCVSMELFADFLARQKDLPVDLPVLDMTGLTGCYDLTLSWVSDARRSGDTSPAADAAAGPALVTALEEQLGLRLEARKAPLEILVVDRAERIPSEN
jgi:uncharacterized protein (TIGR03435 family)